MGVKSREVTAMGARIPSHDPDGLECWIHAEAEAAGRRATVAQLHGRQEFRRVGASLPGAGQNRCGLNGLPSRIEPWTQTERVHLRTGCSRVS
jgi:hypothetical protein